jgi:TM2 domain-containing membrane protein YozV
MTARSFGRKGAIGAAPSPPRIGLVAGQPRSFQPMHRKAPAPDDEIEARRAAFVAEERARSGSGAGPAAQAVSAATESALRAFKARVEFESFPKDRSLRVAYLLWFVTGLAGGHRFYLRRPITGAIQALLFAGCVGAAVFYQYYPAFAGLGLSWLWMVADGFLIRAMYRSAGAP